jgi:integrase
MARVSFTAGRIAAFRCPAGKSQAFMWDTSSPRLGLRVTPSGKPAFVFQGEYEGGSIRIVIGAVNDWTIPKAQAQARLFQTEIDAGRDPRELKAENRASDSAKREAKQREKVTFGEAWSAYLVERKLAWGERHYIDHVKLSHVGGVPCKRPKGSKTVAGPIAGFLPMPLKAITPALLQAWATKEAAHRPARARLSLRLLKAFLSWCAAEPAYQDIANKDAANGKKVKDATGTASAKNDYLQREQLAAWFSYVQQIPNPVIAAYLQCLLLTGARREELTGLKWEDVNFQWHGMSIKDKVDGIRAVPLTPYVAQLIKGLPRRNEYVFSSAGSASGRLIAPDIAHRQACAGAGLEVSLHGLRRSFASLCEWLDIPGGISAQIQGHKPQGVREQNYIRRPIDLLRVHHEKIEAWMLEHGQVGFDAGTTATRLTIVTK